MADTCALEYFADKRDADAYARQLRKAGWRWVRRSASTVYAGMYKVEGWR